MQIKSSLTLSILPQYFCLGVGEFIQMLFCIAIMHKRSKTLIYSNMQCKVMSCTLYFNP